MRYAGRLSVHLLKLRGRFSIAMADGESDRMASSIPIDTTGVTRISKGLRNKIEERATLGRTVGSKRMGLGRVPSPSDYAPFQSPNVWANCPLGTRKHEGGESTLLIS
jgi:hypothetical protein